MKTLARILAIGLLLLGLASFFLGQSPAPLPASDEIYVCPMDPDVRGPDPGTCPRCGMKLVAGIPAPVEYSMDLKVTPPAPRPLQPTRFEFTVRDPWKERPVTKFQIVHEKLFHMFVVSQDMKFFLHNHPTFQEDGSFRYDLALPTPGMYRILGDFYPDGSTPQLFAKTVLGPAVGPPAANLTGACATKAAANMQVQMVTHLPAA